MHEGTSFPVGMVEAIDLERRRQIRAELRKQRVGLRFQIRVHADTDVRGISSHIIVPFLLAIFVYVICTKKAIQCTKFTFQLLKGEPVGNRLPHLQSVA